jgi:glycosyltransferase involved in cell wall biosynthesis
VGVAIPTYNEDPALLARGLNSLLEQTSPVSSITVVDDGSNDRGRRTRHSAGSSGSPASASG